MGFTAFNMKEELEEGHFDKQGHYLWNKEKEIRDNWLDNIDWMQVCKISWSNDFNLRICDRTNPLNLHNCIIRIEVLVV